MTSLTLTHSLGFFTGIDTVTAPIHLKTTTVKTPEGVKAAYPLVSATNVDINNAYKITSRSGVTKKLAGTNIHSFWSNGELALFIDETTLYLLNKDYTKTELLTGLSNEKMSYAQVNDRTYMTNGSYIGYYTNLAMHPLTVPDDKFKVSLPAGQRIAYHKGRLLVAKGQVLYIADALCDHYDVRTGFRVFEDNISMVRPVDDGVYVADGKIWFLIERRAFADDIAEWKKELVLSSDVVPFSDVNIDGVYLGEGIEGNVGMWVTSEGVCVGDNKGGFKVVTPNYLMPSAVIGAATIRNIDGQIHYLATIN